MIIFADADDHTVEERKTILDDEVRKEIKGWDRTNEPIIMWIPKRQIETWIHFLSGNETDEMIRYRHTGKPISCKDQAVKYAQYCQDIDLFDDKELPSMLAGKTEYKRVCELQEKRGE